MTTSAQLFNKLKFLKTFLGVFPLDRLPEIKSIPASLIINTDPHNEPGEHWVAVYISDIGVYFDSYGFPPLNEEIKSFLDTNTTEWTYNTVMIQGYNSYTCGQHCVLFVLLMSIGYSLMDIIHLFTNNFKTNDKIVQKIFENL